MRYMQAMKNNIIPVINQDENLIAELKGYAIVLYVNRVEDIKKVADTIHEPSKIHCIVYENSRCSLSSIYIDPDWKGIPIHLYLSGIGDFSSLAPQLHVLRELDLRVFLYANSPDAITDVQILSSLGVHSGVFLAPNHKYWEEINDLLHYSVYGKINHTPVEPFGFLCRTYNQQEYHQINDVYFNNPRRYLHLNSNAEIYLHREDIQLGEPIAVGIDHLENIHANAHYKNELVAWQNHFLKEDGCAYCPAWRICQGYFDTCGDTAKCTEVMSDLLEGIEFYKISNQKPSSKQLCQL
jgi:hypothetical protein